MGNSSQKQSQVPSTSNNTRMKRDHFSHPGHPLTLSKSDKPFKCYGCKEIGFGYCFHCEDKKCNFYLHEDCGKPSPNSTAYNNFFFSKCQLKFYEQSPVGPLGSCGVCGKDLQGYRFQCLDKKHPSQVHPFCINLKNPFEIDGLEYELSSKVTSRCLYCKSKEISKGFKGWFYVSSRGNHCYHIACAREKEYERLKEDYFSRHGHVGGTSSRSLPSAVSNPQLVRHSSEGNLHSELARRDQRHNQHSTAYPTNLYMEIDHLSHPHQLILKRSEIPYYCYGCKEQGFGSCYQCKDENCNFYLHEQCGMASPTNYHRFFSRCNFTFHEKSPIGDNGYCDACGKDLQGFRYQCLHKDHPSQMHPCCLKLKDTFEIGGSRLELNSHVTSVCTYCKSKKIAKGIKGWSYVSPCGRYCYHIACAKDIEFENLKKRYFARHGNVQGTSSSLSPRNMRPSGEFILHNRGNTGNNITGNRHITSIHFKLYMEMEHFSHSHRLIFKFSQIPYLCDGCEEEGFGPCYSCPNKNCNFNLHEQCAMASPTAYHSFFPGCNFKFENKALVKPVKQCHACGKDVLGFRYQCMNEQHFNPIHAFCIKLKHTTETNGLQVHLREGVTSRCLYCNSKKIAKGIRGWSYESSLGDCCYHVACVRDIVYEKWKNQSFSGPTVQNIEVVPHRNESSGGGMNGEMAKSIFKLAISSYFGQSTCDIIIGVLDILSVNR